MAIRAIDLLDARAYEARELLGTVGAEDDLARGVVVLGAEEGLPVAGPPFGFDAQSAHTSTS